MLPARVPQRVVTQGSQMRPKDSSTIKKFRFQGVRGGGGVIICQRRFPVGSLINLEQPPLGGAASPMVTSSVSLEFVILVKALGAGRLEVAGRAAGPRYRWLPERHKASITEEIV